MKKMLLFILCAEIMSSCNLNRDRTSIMVKYDDTTAVTSSIFNELNIYMREVDSLPYRPMRSAYVLGYDSNDLKIFALCPVMPYLGDRLLNDSAFRLIGCFYKDTILIAIYDRNDNPKGMYDITKLDTDIKKYIPSDSMLQYIRKYPYGEIGPVWRYQMNDDSLKLVEKGQNWIIIQ